MFAAVSCGEAAEGGPASVVEATTKIGELASGLGDLGSMDLTNLDGIKEKVTSMIPNVDAIAKMKETLGDKMPGMDAVKTAVETLTSKFSGNEGVMGAVKPLMDKLNALMG